MNNRNKPGFCVSSVIKVQKEMNAAETAYRFISFPVTATNVTPSYLLYHESAIQELASKLPFLPGSEVQIPFFVYVNDTLYRLVYCVRNSEMRLDVVYSNQTDSIFTRNTSYIYDFIVDDSSLQIQSSHIDDTQPSPPQTILSPIINQGGNS